MCLVVIALGVAPHYRLVVAANRDELHARPTDAARWWPGERVFGGRDRLAGGTWLAVERRGRLAAVTNVRDPDRRSAPRSRGSLVSEFLTSDETAAAYAARVQEAGHEYAAFYLLLYDGQRLAMSSNRAPMRMLPPGLYAVSNAPPAAEWPKTASALAGAEPLLALDDPVEALFALLAERDDSADAETQRQRTHFLVGALYGTRCSTVILEDASGRVAFAERSFDATGTLVGEVRESFALAR